MAAVNYKIMGGTNWVRNVLLTATLFCGPMLVTFSFLNTVAIIYRVGADPALGLLCLGEQHTLQGEQHTLHCVRMHWHTSEIASMGIWRLQMGANAHKVACAGVSWQRL